MMQLARDAERPSSIWASTALPAPHLPRLKGTIKTDVAIVGGGFTGLAAAHHLHQAGVSCAVIEANDVGWGASGRNGGMAVPRFKKGFAALASQYGDAMALRLHAMIHDALDTLEATVKTYDIECGFVQCGHLTAAHSQAAHAALAADTEWLARNAQDRVPRLLDKGAMAAETGTDVYVGGYLDARGAGIHPLNYARGLGRALAERGVPIFVGSPVLRIDDDQAAIETDQGRVEARHVILATNAYSDLTPSSRALHRRVVPVTTSVIATAPLTPNLAQEVLPTRRLVSDTKHLMNYFRIVADNRILFGGRGSINGRHSDAVFAGLRAALTRTYPDVALTEITHVWSGKVAVTLDDFPHLGKLSERVFYAAGYGGRGVALTNLLGKYLAHMITGRPVDAGPISQNRFAPIPFHGLRIPIMQIVAAYYQVRDKLAS